MTETAGSTLHALKIPPFVAPRLLRNPHLQTVLVPFLPSASDTRSERVRIPIDGGALIGHLHRAPDCAPHRTRDRGPDARGCVLALHGIAGTAHEPFLMRTARLANLRGLDALRLHLRGVGESTPHGPSPLYHAGLTSDVRAVLSYLLARYDRVHAVGFSLGGQIVLRTLGEWGVDTPEGIGSCTAISPPLDLLECAEFAERRAATLYRHYIVRTLKGRYATARMTMGERFTEDLVSTVRSIRDYDAAVVAPFFGFADVHDYYTRVSSGAVLDRIRTPTLVIHAADDPLVSPAPIERLSRHAPSHVRVAMTAHGGHVGFYAARPLERDLTRYWAEERAIDLAVATTRV